MLTILRIPQPPKSWNKKARLIAEDDDYDADQENDQDKEETEETSQPKKGLKSRNIRVGRWDEILKKFAKKSKTNKAKRKPKTKATKKPTTPDQTPSKTTTKQEPKAGRKPKPAVVVPYDPFDL